MRFRSLVVSLMLVATACGGSGADNAAPTTAPAGSAGPSSTEAPGSNEAPGTTQAAATDSTAATEPPRTEGPEAPDFTTILADGSTFSLSEHDKPVYLVFWAEW